MTGLPVHSVAKAGTSYSRPQGVKNKFKFQGQELQDDLDLGWYSFKWRNADPALGRFFNIDPLAEDYYYNSPYAFSENRVIDGVELEGLEWKSAKTLNPDGSTKVQFTVDLKIKNSSSLTGDQVNAYSKGIAKQVADSYQGYDKKSNTHFSTNVNITYDQSASEGDFYLEFVNDGQVLSRKTQKPYGVAWGVQGSANQKDGNSQENRIQVQNEADNIVKTGAHEIGHTGGLEDPMSDDKTQSKNGTPLESNNLMQQGQNGTYINVQQLLKILQTVENETKEN